MIGAIDMHRSTLSGLHASPADKTQALKFLARFIGDIHQPLSECINLVKMYNCERLLILFSLLNGVTLAGDFYKWQVLRSRPLGARHRVEALSPSLAILIRSGARGEHRSSVHRVFVLRPCCTEPPSLSVTLWNLWVTVCTVRQCLEQQTGRAEAA